MEISDIKVLECNNLSSIQYKGDNQSSPALFTCKVGDNVELRRGDVINMEYAFINERGCGTPNAVEIKGTFLTRNNELISQTFNESVVVSQGDISLEETSSLTTYGRQVISNSPKTLNLRDDTMNIEMNYYKNVNGEGYYFLPRRFAHENLEPSWLHGASPHQFTKATNNMAQQWNGDDIATTGRCFYELGTGGATKNICMADVLLFFNKDTTGNDKGTTGYYKFASNGDRFTILARDITIYNGRYDDDAGYTEYDAIPKQEHAGNYHIYTELKRISVDSGYNSPNDIAEQITQQLQKAEPRVDYFREDSGATAHAICMTSTTATQTYKPFHSGWFGGNGKDNFTAWRKTAGVTDDDKDLGIPYISSYQYIACKRPELFVAGRKLNTYDDTTTLIKNTINTTGAGNTTDSITTSFLFTEDNLKLMSEIFIQQGNHPELFKDNTTLFGSSDPPAITIDNARFLHINRNPDAELLGYDNIVDEGSNHSSIPVFFKYDNKFEGVMTNGSSTTKLSYGFATNTTPDVAGGYIVLHPELIGGMNKYIFEDQPGNDILEETTLIGWDWHFTAYSTCCIQLYSGYQEWSADGLFSYGLENQESDYLKSGFNMAPYLSKTYLGGNNAAIEYNENGHFQFTYLHTAENTGQGYNAGETDDDSGAGKNINPLIADAGQECYKINKRLQMWTYTPEMRPYDTSTHTINVEIAPKGTGSEVAPLDFTLTNTATQVISELNHSIQPYSVMDAHTGVFFNLGKCFTDKTWDEGLLGILGFTYNQFNPTELNETNTRYARVNYENIYNLKYITTNSQIVTTDAKNYVINRYGGVMYTTQIPAPILLKGWGQMPGGPGGDPPVSREYYSWGIYPPIVEQTQSIQVMSKNVPRRMLRPYYTIRSDILSSNDNKYIGGEAGGERLNVIAVVNKQNGDGDYFFTSESPLQFTITNPINLSSITTSIHDPDQSLSNLQLGSGVIYKISRGAVLDNDIIGEILGTDKKSNKK